MPGVGRAGRGGPTCAIGADGAAVMRGYACSNVRYSIISSVKRGIVALGCGCGAAGGGGGRKSGATKLALELADEPASWGYRSSLVYMVTPVIGL